MSRLTNGCVVPHVNPLAGVENPRLRFIAEAKAAKATPISPAFRTSYSYPTFKVAYDAQDQAAVAADETLSAAEYAARQAQPVVEQAPVVSKPATTVVFDFAHVVPAPHFGEGLSFDLSDLDFVPESDDSDVYRGSIVEADPVDVEIEQLLKDIETNKAQQTTICDQGQAALLRGDQAAADRIYAALTPLHREHTAMTARLDELQAMAVAEPVEVEYCVQDEADRQTENTVHADIVLLDAIDDIREALEAFSEQHEEALERRDDETAQRLVDRIMSAQRDMRELERQYAEGHKVEPAARLVIVEMDAPSNDLGLSDEDYRAYVQDMEAQARLDHDWFDFHEAGLSSVAPQELAESGMAGTSSYVYEA